jgi:starch phosphorylase
VIPCFYERSKGGIPLAWIRMMKASMKMAMQRFSSQRMVRDYQEKFYHPGAGRFQELQDNHADEARQLAEQHLRLILHWKEIHIQPPVVVNPKKFYRVGDAFSITASVHMGVLNPYEVDVELCLGTSKTIDVLEDIQTETMTVNKEFGYGHYQYSCTTTCKASGQFAFTARVIPKGDNWIKYTPGLITWA